MSVLLAMGLVLGLLVMLLVSACLFLVIKFTVLTALLIVHHYTTIRIGLKVAKEVRSLWQ